MLFVLRVSVKPARMSLAFAAETIKANAQPSNPRREGFKDAFHSHISIGFRLGIGTIPLTQIWERLRQAGPMLIIPHNVPCSSHREALDVWQDFKVLLAREAARVIVKVSYHRGFFAVAALDRQHSSFGEEARNVVEDLLQ